MFFRDNVVDPWEMEQRTKLNEKQATAAVKVVSNNIKHHHSQLIAEEVFFKHLNYRLIKMRMEC